jgi:hypothetical protein
MCGRDTDRSWALREHLSEGQLFVVVVGSVDTVGHFGHVAARRTIRCGEQFSFFNEGSVQLIEQAGDACVAVDGIHLPSSLRLVVCVDAHMFMLNAGDLEVNSLGPPILWCRM